MAQTTTGATVGAASAQPSDFENATYRKLSWRLLPLLLLCYLVAYLDRVNVGFAKLQMLKELGFSETIYGLGAGIFFFGYFLFEVPSNLILHRVGARLWIARIMITWGIISAAMMFVTTPAMFYLLRFLLGAAEAGFFPGVILYLTYWYPARRRGRITSLFMTAVALSGVVGGPISGWILKNLDGAHGWQGWQWLFLLEGLPSVLVGLLVLAVLQNGIADARWLNEDERKLLTRNVAGEDAAKEDAPLGRVLSSARVWHMSLIYFSFVVGLYGVGFWLPTIIKATGVADAFQIGVLSAIPYAGAVVAMLAVARSADRRGERRWHVALSGLAGAFGLVLAVAWAQDTLLAMAALTLATMGVLSAVPLFWSLPTALLTGAGAAAGIAMINSLGNLAGFLGPYAMGWLKDHTGSTGLGMYLLASFMLLGAALTLVLPSHMVDK